MTVNDSFSYSNFKTVKSIIKRFITLGRGYFLLPLHSGFQPWVNTQAHNSICYEEDYGTKCYQLRQWIRRYWRRMWSKRWWCLRRNVIWPRDDVTRQIIRFDNSELCSLTWCAVARWSGPFLRCASTHGPLLNTTLWGFSDLSIKVVFWLILRSHFSSGDKSNQA